MVVDANVWIGVLRRADVHHAASLAWMTATIKTGAALFAPGLVLAEVAGPVARLTGIPETGLKAAHLRLRGWTRYRSQPPAGTACLSSPGTSNWPAGPQAPSKQFSPSRVL